MGRHCRELSVTLRVASYHDGPRSGDDEATWLFGHTERMSFGRPWRHRGYLMAEAILAVPCRHLEGGGPWAHCRAHGFKSKLPPGRHAAVPRQLPGDRFEYVHRGQLVAGTLAPNTGSRRSLPVAASDNPCATAPCRTANNERGVACCRDLQVEILCSPRATWLESLIRHRAPPYLCKVERESDDSLGAELISACGYLDQARSGCVLHDRQRPDGSRAKPELCYEWPDGAEVFHTKCLFRPEARDCK
ncbi:MAG: hypothetical protein FJ206_08475 [Gemmatimonadetes bacterium]|nr:hypothetical protein [Gemmatimonadota bacterium]